MELEDIGIIFILLLLFVGLPFLGIVGLANWGAHSTVDRIQNETYYSFQIPNFQDADKVQFDVHTNFGWPVAQTYYIYKTPETLPLPQNASFYTKDANITVTLSVDYFKSIDGLYTKIGSKDYLIDLVTSSSEKVEPEKNK